MSVEQRVRRLSRVTPLAGPEEQTSRHAAPLNASVLRHCVRLNCAYLQHLFRPTPRRFKKEF
jgi:hypothetical protein